MTLDLWAISIAVASLVISLVNGLVIVLRDRQQPHDIHGCYRAAEARANRDLEAQWDRTDALLQEAYLNRQGRQ